MRSFNIIAFDDLISGTASTWYTSSDLDEVLGASDAMVLHAATSAVTGTGPTLTCQVEHSASTEDWAAVGSAQISTSIANDGSYRGLIDNFNPVLLGFVRVKVTLGGTSPACRLKLYVTGKESVVRESRERPVQAKGAGKNAKDGKSSDCGCDPPSVIGVSGGPVLIGATAQRKAAVAQLSIASAFRAKGT